MTKNYNIFGYFFEFLGYIPQTMEKKASKNTKPTQPIIDHEVI